MPFGQPVSDTSKTQPNGTTKLSNNKTLKTKQNKNRTIRGDAGEGDEVQKKKITKWELDESS